MQAFIKALNIDMVFALAAQLKISDLQPIKEDLVEKLRSASRYEDAADLIDPLVEFDLALDCYLKANSYQKAIKLCL